MGLRPGPDEMTVFDDNIGDYSRSQLYFRSAVAYSDACLNTSEALLARRLPRTYAHAQVVHFLLDHALELFLKGAILARNDEASRNHRLDQLHARYEELYPESEFRFSGRISETVHPDPNSPHSEFPRYPENKRGDLWFGPNAYTLDTWHSEAETMRADIARLVSLIDPLPPKPLGPKSAL